MSLEHSPVRQAGRGAYSIAEFCVAHRISRSKFYQLVKQGLAPRMMCIGKRRLVSVEAAIDWRREREAASSGEEA